MTQGSIVSTIAGLLEEKGLELLDNPLRLEGFLRDLHYDKPREVYLIIEMMHSGIVEKIRSEKPSLDSEFNGFAAQLSAKSGTAPTFAMWAVQTWRDALPNSAYVQRQTPKEKKTPPRWLGSVDEVLGKRIANT